MAARHGGVDLDQTPNTITVNVTPVNDAPMVAHAIADQNVTQGSAYLFQFAANTFSDVDGDPLTYTATLSNDTPLPTWLSFNASTRTFSGTPTNTDVGTVVVKVTATDGSNASMSDIFDIVVGNTNDAPVLNAGATPVLTAENEDAGAPVGAVGTLVSSLVNLTPPAGELDNVTDADSGAVTGIALTATNTTNGSWFYSLDNGSSWTAVGAVADNSALLLGADGNTRLYFQPNANFSGIVSNAITFRAWDQTSGAAGSKVDTSGGGSSSAFSTATDTANIAVNAVNDAPVLDASKSPVIGSVGEDASAPVGISVGNLVSGNVVNLNQAAGNVTDPDNGALTGIAIIGTNSANGNWFYTTDNGNNWIAVGSVSNTSALLLNADVNTKLYFQPNANFNGTISDAITFRAWDRTSGTAGNKVDVSVNGSSTAFSSAFDTASFVVNPANDAPVASGSATLAAINEDAAAPAGATVSSLFGGNFSDATDQVSGGSSANTFAGIAISSYTVDASKGAWQYSSNGGSSWTALGSATTAAAITLNASDLLRFVPAANYNGAATALSANLIESGQAITSGVTLNLTGATGGTTHISSATVALSETVTAVNDAPVASGSATLAAINEDAAAPAGATVSSLFGGNFSDATDQVSGGSSANTFAGIAISSYTVDASKGAWQYSSNGGSNWTALGSATTAAAITLNASDLLRFVPAANYNGAATALSANLIESGQAITSGVTLNLTGATGGTTHISSATVALSETVNAVNDAPVLNAAATPVLAVENENAGAPVGAVGTLISSLVDLNPPTGGLDNVTDVDSGAATGIALVAAGTTNGSWWYSLDNGAHWTDVNAGSAVSNTNALLLAADSGTRIYFQPNANFNGTINPAITFRAWDQTTGAAGTKVNPAPEAGQPHFPRQATPQISQSMPQTTRRSSRSSTR